MTDIHARQAAGAIRRGSVIDPRAASALNAAILRNGASLDLDTVPDGVVESTSAPTGASDVVNATVGDGGQVTVR